MIRIEHNVETGEIKKIELTADEISDTLARQEAAKPKVLEIEKQIAAKAAAEQAVTDAKASRDAKLAKMGFTLAEIENW